MMPIEIMIIANTSNSVTLSLKIITPRINVKMVDNARNNPSERPNGFLERTYPIISLDVKANPKADIIRRFDTNETQNSS